MIFITSLVIGIGSLPIYFFYFRFCKEAVDLPSSTHIVLFFHILTFIVLKLLYNYAELKYALLFGASFISVMRITALRGRIIWDCQTQNITFMFLMLFALCMFYFYDD